MVSVCLGKCVKDTYEMQASIGQILLLLVVWC